MPPLRSPKPIPQKKSRHWYEYATLLAYLTILVVLSAGGFFLLKPRYDTILAIRQQIAASSEEQRNKQASLGSLHKLIDRAHTVGEHDGARLAYMMPNTADLPGLFVQLEALTQASGLTVQSIRADEKGQPVAKAPGALALPFDIAYEVSAADPYQVLKQSLAAFEQNLRLFDIQEFSFEVKDTDAQGSVAAGAAKRAMQMKFFTYYFPQK